MKRFLGKGDFFIWLTGVALAVILVMTAGLLFLVMKNGLAFFWPGEVALLTLKNGTFVQGEIVARETIPQPDAPPETPPLHRIKIKQGNRDMSGVDFVWIDEASIVSKRYPPEATVFERLEWGDFYGVVEAVKESGQATARGGEAAWRKLQEQLPRTTKVVGRIKTIQKKDIGKVSRRMEKIRLRLKKYALQGGASAAESAAAEKEMTALRKRFAEYEVQLRTLRSSLSNHVVVTTANGRDKEIPLAQIVRVYRPNTFGPLDKTVFFVEKIIEFIFDDPRESNTEGGIFPALFGTVMMVIVMSIFAAPLGILAAFYLREYARPGPFVSMVRIAVNNLAGVPSIVFGVFGVGFFIYAIGGSIDRVFFPESLPTPTFGTGGILWASLTLALLTVPVVIVATEEGLAAVSPGIREASLALGATKAETLRRAVLPVVMPSILTGLILAMARAAGEVAPLMITGVVKLAPALPVDFTEPFIHLERKFMHLGFHIYDVGFQSPNVDAARPMVFATTLLLIGIVLLLNYAAIMLRTRLRRKLAGGAL
ncbi:MAG: phosphate ABC transporter permease PstA [Nitrospinales bacterium]